MKKAVIAYLLAVLIISLIGLSVGITVADGDGPGDNPWSSANNDGVHIQDDNGGFSGTDQQFGDKYIDPLCGNWFTPTELKA